MLILSGMSHFLGGCKVETLSCTSEPLITSNTCHLNLSGDLQHDFWRLMLQSAPLVFGADGRSSRWVLSLLLTKQVIIQTTQFFLPSVVNFMQSCPCYDNFASIWVSLTMKEFYVKFVPHFDSFSTYWLRRSGHEDSWQLFAAMGGGLYIKDTIDSLPKMFLSPSGLK